MPPLLRAVIHRAPPRLRAAVELVLRTGYDTVHDRAHGLAAEVAFFVILSVPPLLVTMLTLTHPLGQAFDADFSTDLTATIRNTAQAVFTDETINDVIMPAVESVTSGQTGTDIGVLSTLVAIWAASRATSVILKAVIDAYDLEPIRSGWQQRLWSLGLTLVGMVGGLLIVPVMVAGPDFGMVVSNRLGINAGLGMLWRIGYWPGVVVVATGLIASLYHFGTPWRTPWRRDLAGAMLAMSVWLAGSALLRVYTTRSIISSETLYGPIAGPVVVLGWIWVSAFALLLGAELNAEIEKMWPTAPQKGAHPVPDRIGQSSQLSLETDGGLPVPWPTEQR